jgi:hypothetical protein
LIRTDEKRVENTDEELVKCCRECLCTLRNENDIPIFGVFDMEDPSHRSLHKQSKNKLPARGVVVPLLIRIVKEITAKMKRSQVVEQVGSSIDTVDPSPLTENDYIAIYNSTGDLQ